MLGRNSDAKDGRERVSTGGVGPVGSGPDRRCFDPALGLGSARMDWLDIEGLQGAGELGDFPFVIGMIDPKDAVAIRVERDRAVMRL